MSDYPRMLYKAGGEELHHGLTCETMLAEGPEHEGMVHADGWRRTPAEAHGQTPGPAAQTGDQVELTRLRAELQSAAELVADLNQRIETLTAERDEAIAQVADLTAPAAEPTAEAGKPAEQGEGAKPGRQRQKETADA